MLSTSTKLTRATAQLILRLSFLVLRNTLMSTWKTSGVANLYPVVMLYDEIFSMVLTA